MNPALRQALLREPAVVAGAVEEILRLPLPVPAPAPAPEGAGGLPRWAKVDMDVEGMVVRAGELVLLDLQDANLDDQVFHGPERLDPSRAQNAHLTFGHGAHYCIGAPLARMELQLLFGALVRRFPTLQLAVDVEDLCPRSHLLTGGLQSLPVTW
jgi:cytochrome P450